MFQVFKVHAIEASLQSTVCIPHSVLTIQLYIP